MKLKKPLTMSKKYPKTPLGKAEAKFFHKIFD